MTSSLIDGLIVKNLDIINHRNGNIFRGLKKNESSYQGFGELYFSAINYLDIKGWKKHKEMTMNLISVSGEIKLVIYDDRDLSATKGNFFETNLSIFKNFQRVSVPPNVWFGFQGLSKELNLLANLSNIEHDPNESENVMLSEINYHW